jgi:MAP7 domain-containing protein 1
VKRIATWKDGHEEIMSIPHSFAVEFNDDESPWFFYTDSEEAKVRVPMS